MSICEFQDVEKVFGSNKVLTDINFKLSKKAIIPLLGPNGAGKTTIIKLLLGEYLPDHGKVYLFDEELAFDNLKRVGYVPERIEFPNVTVRTILRYMGSLRGMSHQESDKMIKQLIKWLDIEFKLNSPINKLSAGMKQKVIIIQSLIKKPKLLIMDEPTSNLDIFSREKMFNLIKQLNEETDITILFSTHILSDLNSYYKQLLLLKNGRIIHNGSSSTLFSNNQKKFIYLKTNNTSKTLEILKNKPITLLNSLEKDRERLLFSITNIEEKSFLRLLKDIFEDLEENNIILNNFSFEDKLKSRILEKFK